MSEPVVIESDEEMSEVGEEVEDERPRFDTMETTEVAPQASAPAAESEWQPFTRKLVQEGKKYKILLKALPGQTEEQRETYELPAKVLDECGMLKSLISTDGVDLSDTAIPIARDAPDGMTKELMDEMVEYYIQLWEKAELQEREDVDQAKRDEEAKKKHKEEMASKGIVPTAVASGDEAAEITVEPTILERPAEQNKRLAAYHHSLIDKLKPDMLNEHMKVKMDELTVEAMTPCMYAHHGIPKYHDRLHMGNYLCAEHWLVYVADEYTVFLDQFQKKRPELLINETAIAKQLHNARLDKVVNPTFTMPTHEELEAVSRSGAWQSVLDTGSK